MNSGNNAGKRVVSRRIIIRGDKAGEVRPARSLAAAVDALEADAIEETATTRAYVRRSPPRQEPPPPPPVFMVPLEPPPPPAPVFMVPLEPPVSVPPVMVASAPPLGEDAPRARVSPPATPRARPAEPRTPATDEGCDPIGCFFVVCVAVVVLAGIGSVFMPTRDVLVGASWHVRAPVEERHLRHAEGWDLPADVVAVLAADTRQKGSRHVVDHYVDVCRAVTETQQVPDGVDTLCAPVQVGFTEPLEIYSHTEELCYDDGSCEEKDVYTKGPAQPIFQERCQMVERFRPVATTRQVCTPEPVMRAEPVMATYYTYSHHAWTPNGSVVERAGAAPEPVPDDDDAALSLLPSLLESNGTTARYGRLDWTFRLAYKKHGARHVSRAVYAECVMHLNETVVVY